MSDSSYLCPAGYDCIGKSSCPSPVISCPSGYFCDSYANDAPLKSLDLAYAMYKNLFSDNDVTTSNYEEYVEPYRQIQSLCMQGFYCPNATTILPCPEGYWCSEGTISPIKCDSLSSCPEKSFYEVNYVNAILALILSILIAIASFMLNRNQRNKSIESKLFNYKSDSSRASKNALSARNLAKESPVGLEVLMIDYSYEVKNSNSHSNVTEPSTVRLLSNITAKFSAGSLIAILGPSGCGKTTLLQAISNQSQGVLRTGNIDIYSTPVLYEENNLQASDIFRMEVSQIRRRIGFVPQDDIIDRNLTVRELLMFNARIRQPSLTTTEIEAVVEEVMLDLNIRHIADTVIGGSANKSANVSGGQLKRINIATELVSLARPALLLLDEPTSGLDAAIANELFENLQKLCRSGITIITVLQQPREEIFYRLDEVILMALGGHVVYQGPPQQASQRFLQHGYIQNSVSADADYCLDVLNGVIPRDSSFGTISTNAAYIIADRSLHSNVKRSGNTTISPSDHVAVSIHQMEDLLCQYLYSYP